MLREAVADGHRVRPQGQGVHGRRPAAARRDHARASSTSASPSPTSREHGFLLDGFPRTVGPGRGPRSASPPIDVAVNLEVPEDVVLERLVEPSGLRELRRASTRPPSRRRTTGPATPAGARSCSATTTRPRRSAKRLEAYERETVPADRLVRPSTGLLVDRRRPGHARRGLRAAPRRDRRPRSRAESLTMARSRRSDRRRARRDAQGRPGRRRDARAHPRRDPARGHHRASSTRSAATCIERRGATLELPRLPRLPGGDLRVAERHDRARHPRRRTVLRRGRHHLDRLRGDRRRLARRRRLHRRGGRDLRRGRRA